MTESVGNHTLSTVRTMMINCIIKRSKAGSGTKISPLDVLFTLPYWIYCAEIWGHNNKNSLYSLSVLQKKSN